MTLLQPGFLASVPVQNALLIGAGAALLSGAAGVFTVLRSQSFAGHALADVSSAGGAMAYLLGISPLLGFFSLSVLGALALEAIGTRRAAERDLAAGIVLGAGMGVTALLLYLDVTVKGSAGAAVSVMFGSIFAAPPGLGVAVALGALAGLVGLGLIYRPLLLASLDGELAKADGVNTRLLGAAYLLLLALAVTLSAMAVGAILSTALLIGPAASALRLARSPAAAMGLAALLGLFCAWGGVWLAYQSYGWTPGHVWPVSFFITALVLAVYAAASLVRRG
ncbi:MAG: metal ABC transporter permease [Acidocella sp.]|nr:metal ABC transporter permease [Acidocella sp.]MDR3683555.1 metal ABC transporter permease [Geothrix sp.]